MNDVNVVITYVMYYYTYIYVMYTHTVHTCGGHGTLCNNIRTCKNYMYHQLHVPFLQQDITVSIFTVVGI